jgi:hypothetical protein
MSDIKNAVRILRTSAPGPFNALVAHIDDQKSAANSVLVNSIAGKTMRQAQGKVQELEALLVLLRS